jgi:hypothetical protein
MKNEQEIFKNIDNFLNNRITVKEFWDNSRALRRTPFKPWNTDLWKKNREKKLKECCEKCGSKEQLTIQHTWHPKSYDHHLYFTKVGATHSDLMENLHKRVREKIEFSISCEYSNPVCPSCESENIRLIKRTTTHRRTSNLRESSKLIKTDTQWRCSSIGGCRKFFDTPKILTIPTTVRNKEKDIKKQVYQHVATEKWLKGTLRYIEMREEDHYTACRNCAYKEDLENGLITALI